MIAAGMFDDIDEQAYHADKLTLSQSGAKAILRAPAIYRWQTDNGRPERQTFDIGHAAHKLVLGVGQPIHVVDAADWRTKDARAARDEAYARGDVPLLRKDFDAVQAMADKLSEHRLAMQLLSNGRPEVSAYAQDPDTSVWMRGRCDWLGERIITDYKTTRSSEPDAFMRSAITYGYHIQQAWYLDLFATIGHPAEAFAFIAQETEPPHIVTVIELPGDLVDKGRAKYRRALEIFRDCTAANVWPGYIADDTFAQPSAPLWALRDEDAA